MHFDNIKATFFWTDLGGKQAKGSPSIPKAGTRFSRMVIR
jgi:hypothetical protein